MDRIRALLGIELQPKLLDGTTQPTGEIRTSGDPMSKAKRLSPAFGQTRELSLGWVRYHLTQWEFRQARLLARALLKANPQNAEAWYLLGCAFEQDPFGCDLRARRSYRKAMTTNADEPKYRAALGRALIRTKSTNAGIKVLRQALTSAPADLNVLQVVVESFAEVGLADEAYQIICKARFSAPKCQQLKRLVHLAQFNRGVEEQQKLKAMNQSPVEDAVVLPFMRIVPDGQKIESTNRYRQDSESHSQPHIARLRAFRREV